MIAHASQLKQQPGIDWNVVFTAMLPTILYNLNFEFKKLDDERKASMVSNLLVVLCGEAEVSPVINTGTLYP